MKTMQIFEPAMCCSTGLCGATVDPELLRISTVLDILKKHTISVERYNLTSTPMAFINNKIISKFLFDKGPDSLPVVLLDDKIILIGRYPANAEFIKWLDLPADLLNKIAEKPQNNDCCTGGCC
ncbi:arsenite efflux transporter metallochaperone ArsD [Pectinatus frisingensis]|jgi:hypothetical protein|uniref:arsenite efflux transporter metallochaperone ArsD n=1 Tax=Pectinatus frisingensis TaxID=865 RepID=UPI0015F42B9F|nr:arsenite efflux transporter metallochaperone ArsD [Pectinatus frisingensis]